MTPQAIPAIQRLSPVQERKDGARGNTHLSGHLYFTNNNYDHGKNREERSLPLRLREKI
jgi:hypothetical protein